MKEKFTKCIIHLIYLVRENDVKKLLPTVHLRHLHSRTITMLQMFEYMDMNVQHAVE